MRAPATKSHSVGVYIATEWNYFRALPDKRLVFVNNVQGGEKHWRFSKNELGNNN